MQAGEGKGQGGQGGSEDGHLLCPPQLPPDSFKGSWHFWVLLHGLRVEMSRHTNLGPMYVRSLLLSCVVTHTVPNGGNNS